MEAGNIIALVSAVLAGIVAVWVPWLAFRFALRQEQERWLREQRAELYADMLTEAYAEQQHLEFALLDEEARERVPFTDLRLPPLERAQLGTRANIFGNGEINRLFMRLQQVGFWAVIPTGAEREARRIQVRMDAERAVEELQKAIRREVGADRIERRWRIRR